MSDSFHDSLDAARERAGFAHTLGDGTEEYAAKAAPSAESDAARCPGSIPLGHARGVFPDHCSVCAAYDGPRRRTEAESRRCSQEGCPGDGRYQPPGRGHLPGCQHDATAWVWETVTPPAETGVES